MKRYALIHFKPLGIQSVRICSDETIVDALARFAEKVGEQVTHEDSYAHQLKDGSLYQIVEIEV